MISSHRDSLAAFSTGASEGVVTKIPTDEREDCNSWYQMCAKHRPLSRCPSALFALLALFRPAAHFPQPTARQPGHKPLLRDSVQYSPRMTKQK